MNPQTAEYEYWMNHTTLIDPATNTKERNVLKVCVEKARDGWLLGLEIYIQSQTPDGLVEKEHKWGSQARHPPLYSNKDVLSHLSLELLLFHAIAKRDAEGVDELLTVRRVDPNTQAVLGDNGATLLHHAVSEGSVNIVSKLVEAGANLNTVDRDKKTPLVKAVEGKNHFVIDHLLSSGAELSTKDCKGQTVLHAAAFSGDARIVEKVVGKGLDCDDSNCFGSTPLHFAAMSGDVSSVSLLLSRGASPLKYDNQGYTPLKVAEKWGHCDLLRVLMEAEKEAITKDLAISNATNTSVDGSSLLAAIESTTPETGLQAMR